MVSGRILVSASLKTCVLFSSLYFPCGFEEWRALVSHSLMGSLHSCLLSCHLTTALRACELETLAKMRRRSLAVV